MFCCIRSPDGQLLVMSSTDGYLSAVMMAPELTGRGMAMQKQIEVSL